MEGGSGDTRPLGVFLCVFCPLRLFVESVFTSLTTRSYSIDPIGFGLQTSRAFDITVCLIARLSHPHRWTSALFLLFFSFFSLSQPGAVLLHLPPTPSFTNRSPTLLLSKVSRPYCAA